MQRSCLSRWICLGAFVALMMALDLIQVAPAVGQEIDDPASAAGMAAEQPPVLAEPVPGDLSGGVQPAAEVDTPRPRGAGRCP
jgi:hypothetical protein